MGDIPRHGDNYRRVDMTIEMMDVTLSAYAQAIRRAEAAGRPIADLLKARDELRAQYEKEKARRK